MPELTLLTDYYELTMANGYFENGLSETVACFELFFRKVPDDGGFAIFSGLEQIVTYLRNLKFSEQDINFLRGKGIFSGNFLEYLSNFRFSCDVWAVPEGTPVFPGEPLIKVRGPVIEAQFVETMLLLLANHQSLIATKANRIARAAGKRKVMEFGSRRAQGCSGALYGARAAYIGGCAASACTLAGEKFGIPVGGTMAHSWIQIFDSELEAFQAYARVYPEDCVFLVDTYSVLESGIPNAIEAARTELLPRGCRLNGIRIDSGDIAVLSREARKMLDAAGFEDCRIVASDALDEYEIHTLLSRGACIDVFGVGERLITARSEPVFGGVYKLVATEQNGKTVPKIKLSENAAKSTLPGAKKLWRLFSADSGEAVADVISDETENFAGITSFDVIDRETNCSRIFTGCLARELLIPVYSGGKLLYKLPQLGEIRNHCAAAVATLPEDVIRISRPQKYPVCITKKIADIIEGLRAFE